MHAHPTETAAAPSRNHRRSIRQKPWSPHHAIIAAISETAHQSPLIEAAAVRLLNYSVQQRSLFFLLNFFSVVGPPLISPSTETSEEQQHHDEHSSNPLHSSRSLRWCLRGLSIGGSVGCGGALVSRCHYCDHGYGIAGVEEEQAAASTMPGTQRCFPIPAAQQLRSTYAALSGIHHRSLCQYGP